MMEIVNVRIDERLIHGQVAAIWANSLKATRIMVIDDMAVKDDVQKIALQMVCPSTVKLSILSVQRAVERFKEDTYPDDRIFVVLKGPQTLLALLDEGCLFPEVNVGNMSGKPQSVTVKRSIHATTAEIACFRECARRGVKFTAQMVPSEPAVDFIGLLPQ